MTDFLSDPGDFTGAHGTAVDTTNSALPNAFTAVTHAAGTLTFSNVASPARPFVYEFVPVSGNTDRVEWTNLSGATTSSSWAFEFYLTGLPATNQAIVNARSAGGGTGLYTVQLTPAGNLYVANDVAGSPVGTSTASLSVGTWYRMEGQATAPTASTGTLSIKVYPAAATSAVATVTGSGLNLGTVDQGTLYVGKTSSTGAMPTMRVGAVAFRTGSSTAWGPFVAAHVAPTADATAQVTGQTVRFSSNGSVAESPATIVSRSWDYGNGVTSTTANPNYRYPAMGSYTATLTVTDSNGLTDTDTVAVVTTARSSSVKLIEATLTYLTPTSGTAVSVLGDTDGSTFVAGDNVTGHKAVLDGRFEPLELTAGLPFVVVVRGDVWDTTPATVSAEWRDFDGTTVRGTVASATVATYDDTSDGGPTGNGNLAAGVVNRFFELEFTSSAVALMSEMGRDYSRLVITEL